MAEKNAQGLSMAAAAHEPPLSYAAQAPPGDFPMAAVGGTPNPGGYPYNAPPPAIVEQWVPPAPAVNDCPYGMENLVQMDKIGVHPVVRACPEYRGYQSSNKYAVRNQEHNRVYFGAEERIESCGGCCRTCYGVEIKLADQTGTVLLTFSRSFTCCVTCLICFRRPLSKMAVATGDGTVLGYVQHDAPIFTPTLSILNAQNETVLGIVGPRIGNVEWQTKSVKEFMISTGSGANIGSICRMWDYYNRDITGYDNGFNIDCPVDLDVKMKACLIGAALLLDGHYFRARLRQ